MIDPSRHRSTVFGAVPLFAGILRAAVLAFVGSLAWNGPGLTAAEEPVRLVTNQADYWRLSNEARARVEQFRVECDILYFDPEWGVLWLEDSTGPTFVSTGGAPWPIKSGQRVRITGRPRSESGNLSIESPEFQILGTANTTAIDVGGRLTQAALFTNHLVAVDGFVDRQALSDPTRLRLTLSIEGRPVDAWVQLTPEVRVPEFVGSSVRLRGVYNPKVTPGGALASLEILVPSLAGVSVLSRLEDDPRFRRPAVALNALPSHSIDTLVHVVGEVHEQVPGKRLILRDATGQVVIHSAQTQVLREHEAVEAIGYPVIRGTEWSLENALFRRRQVAPPGEPAVAAAPVAATEKTVCSIQDFWELPAEQRLSPQALQLDCTVLYYDPEWRHLFVHDGVHRTFVLQGDRTLPIRAGQRIRATGRLAPPNSDLSFAQASVAVLGNETLTSTPLGDWSKPSTDLTNQLVWAEGVVDRQEAKTPGHLRLFLSVEGRPLYAWVLVPAGMAPPDFTGAMVRVNGVCNPKIAPDGSLASLELMVPAPDRVEVLGRLATDPRFELSATAIDQLPGRAARQLTRISGRVFSQQPGRSVHVRDATGLVDVRSAQTTPLAVNDEVEAVGFPVTDGGEWRLSEALYRPVRESAAAKAAKEAATLRLAAQILELSPEEASAGAAVKLTGVVTWSHPSKSFFFLQDASGGVQVACTAGSDMIRSPERNVEVRGVTTMGDFAPIVVATSVEKIGDLLLPETRPISLEHALTGVEEAQWVELRGYLREVREDADWTRLEVATAAGDFQALLPPGEKPAARPGAVVRISGVCSATLAAGKIDGIRLYVPKAAKVQVEEPAPTDVFDVPRRPIASLGRFTTTQAFNRRVKVSGTVLHAATGRFVLSEGNDSLVALTRDGVMPTLGDRVDAVGFLGRQGSRVVLRETVFRRQGKGVTPSPLRLTAVTGVDPGADGQLVQISGTLIDRSFVGDALRLTMQTEATLFAAELDRPGDWREADLPSKGSRLALTGVYEVRYDEYGKSRSFGLLLRRRGDVRLLEEPSWFTPGRILAFTGALALGTAGVIAWVVALRRRVRRQTAQIRLQLQRESHLQGELERALRLESLGILAGGIAHDFNNLLTVVMGNVSLARLDKGLEPDTDQSLGEAERAVTRARDLTQQLLTFAKGGAPIRSAVVLSDVVREITQFVLRGSSVSATYDIAPDLWPAEVDKGQVGQVVQNIVINGTQAMPEGGRLEVKLANETVTDGGSAVLTPGRYLKLSVKDHGRGIKPEHLTRIFDPYFTTKKQGSGLGLATVYSIVKRHGGHIAVESKVGAGTTFHVWVPAAGATAVAAVPEKKTRPAEAPSTSDGRILVMDDEESIRRLSSTILRRAGFEVTAVKDGAEAVSEYGSALATGRGYDVVVFDLTVPGGMGGKQALEELRKIHPAVKAIVSSGYSNDPSLADHRSLGFTAMVSKPYEIATFVQTVRSVLRGEAS